MNIGVCGTGTIASWTSSIINQLNDEKICLYACATAPGFDCSEFAAKFGWKKIHATYKDLMEDPQVDLVYICVPNTFHYELCKQALELGKPVLVEKPFAINDTEAKELVALAREKKLFLAEAHWPSYLPMRKKIDDELASGIIGTVTGGKIIALDNVLFLGRVKDPALGGGTMLDNGPYTLGRMCDHFGWDIKSVEAKVRKFETGVDAEAEFTVEYNDGRKVYIRQTMDTPREQFENYCEIYGTEGRVFIDAVANANSAKFFDKDGNLIKELTAEPQIHNQGMPPVSGYEYEFIAFEKALREGKTECEEAPLAMTVAIAEVMTEVRRQGGVKFPFEK